MLPEEEREKNMISMSECVFCGERVSSRDRNCPHCGGTNENYVSAYSHAFSLPKTMEELKEYCVERKIPLEQLRFFIGEDYHAPRAYGIFKAGDHRFIVYKNKSDGSRSARYDGPDEAFAVSELFAKLLEICQRSGILAINVRGNK